MDDDALHLLRALDFAAQRHRDQRRKGDESSPYINHLIRVATLLADVGGLRDVELLQAAVLHDTLEDTRTTADELEAGFGERVRRLVEYMTDDRTLPKQERKRRQIEQAPTLPPDAKLLKLADKIANVVDVAEAPPRDWSLERKREYLAWAEAVVAHCLGVNPALDEHWRRVAAAARHRLGHAANEEAP